MFERSTPRVAIVDYGMGNLFSVKQACQQVGLDVFISTDRGDIKGADAVILPGVGAFGDAMESLRQMNLVDTLQEIGGSDKPLIGICLGMQLFMSESDEFGRHEGLGLIPGLVVPLKPSNYNLPNLREHSHRTSKIPQVGWNRIYRSDALTDSSGSYASKQSNRIKNPWSDTFLTGVREGEYMYFVHSFCVEPDDPSVILTKTRHGSVEFCSTLSYKNIFACQFHPERSASQGMRIYRNIANKINTEIRS